MKCIENSATSSLLILPRKNSRHDISKFSIEMISLKIWQSLLLSLSLSENSILSRIKQGYLVWMNIVPHIPKNARYTIGTRIENKFLDLLEISYTAYFSNKEKKLEKISHCIFVLDILKFLISIAWEAKLLSHKQYEEIAINLSEVGKMFGGWKKSFDNPEKKNRIV